MNSESESMGAVTDDLLSRPGTLTPASPAPASDAAHAQELAQLTEKILEQDRTIKEMRLEHIEATTRIIAAHSETIRKITQDHAETHRHALDALVKVAALRDLPSPKSE